VNVIGEVAEVGYFADQEIIMIRYQLQTSHARTRHPGYQSSPILITIRQLLNTIPRNSQEATQ